MTHPSGTVTFLFTDIEGSTKLAQGHPDKWDALQQRHHAILQSAMDVHNGYVFQIIGDAFCTAFHTASDGLHSAIETQRKLQSEDWGDTPIKVRMGIHTGEAELQSTGDYHGYLAMSRVQRLMSVGHGGQVLVSQATQELIRDDLPKDVNLRDMGERRLKDLVRPEHIYQLDIEGLPIDFPALKTLDKYRHNLPTQLTSFIGREKEMAEIKTALNEHRLVTLTGSGGAGKTRLSLQVAAELLDQFPNGVWFVELAPITDPDLIPQTILSAADMQTQQGRSALESLKDFLREKTSLIVLDNCEHMIEACAKLTDTLLHIAPNLKILASSREALGVRGEQAWHVPSLSIPDVKHLPAVEHLSQYEAVRLFIDRALLVQPHFAVTNDNAPAVAQICSRLDGIPLAIELAAARVKVLKAEQIAERLNDRFRLLTGGLRTALPRQQTLRALIDWSYDLLFENEKILLRRLSVFMGGWTLEAAEQVCSDETIKGDDVLDLLTHLVDKSLVVIDEQPTQLRYRMLETVRQYAREKLFESGEGEKARDRHLQAFIELAEKAEPEIRSFNQLVWLDRLEAEIDNLRTALEWSQERDKESFLRLASALWRFWSIRGQFADQEWLPKALAVTEDLQTVLRARALGRAAYISFFGGDLANSQLGKAFAQEAVILSRAVDDRASLAMVLSVQSYFETEYSQKLAVLDEALILAREIGDHWLAEFALRIRADLFMIQNDLASAQSFYEEALKEAHDSGDRRLIGGVLGCLGDIFLAQGNAPQAEKVYWEVLGGFQEMKDYVAIRYVRRSILDAKIFQEDYAGAKEMMGEEFRLAETGSKASLAWAFWYSAMIDLAQGNIFLAIEQFEEGLILVKQTKEQYLITRITLGLGEALWHKKDFVQAGTRYRETLTLIKEENLIGDWLDCLEGLGKLAIDQGQMERGVRLLAARKKLSDSSLTYVYPFMAREREARIAAARAQLDEVTFNAAWAEGRAMKMEDAIEYALKELEK